MKTPVAFIIFNRPDTTAKVFEAIRQAKPPKLLVIADGPRSDCPDEAAKCAAVRAIIESVDWECEVLTNYSDVNLGCKLRVSSGLNWVFDTVEEAIILEDDCLPDPSFFPFCEELLERHRYDQRIVVISGNNFQDGQKRTDYSYYFSVYNHCWGWASWRRAWKNYDVEMNAWAKIRDQKYLSSIFNKPSEINFWQRSFQLVYDGKIDTWDIAWTFSCWTQYGLTILPNVNLVSNIGFREDATHTITKNDKSANIPAITMNFPLKNPSFVMRNIQADSYTQSNHYYNPSLLSRIKKKLINILS